VELYDSEGPLGHKRPANIILFKFSEVGVLFTATLRTRKKFLSCQITFHGLGLNNLNNKRPVRLYVGRQILASIN